MALDPTQLVAPDYASMVGARASAVDPNVAEYYNPQNNQVFGNPDDLAGFVNTNYNRQDVNPTNVFDVLKTATPQASVNPAYQKNIGVRQLAGQPQYEYFDKSNNQVFSDPDTLAEYFKTTYNRNDVTGDNVFEQLKSAPPTKLDQLRETVFSELPKSANIYDEEFNKAGLGDVKTQLLGINDEIAKIKAKYTETQGNINENPWLSEASRTGRTRVLNEQMQAEIGNLLDQKARIAELYNMGLSEVSLRAGLRTDDVNNARNLQQQEFEFLINQQVDEESKREVARQFAIDNQVEMPYYQVGGTVYRASDGKAYTSQEEFFADTGESNFANVQQTLTTPEMREQAFREKQYDRSVYESDRDYNRSVTESDRDYAFETGGTNYFGEQVGTSFGLPTYNTRAASPGMNRSDRNNNPGNIKASDYTKAFGGVVGVEASSAADGGNFLIFDSPEAGFQAMAKLLKEGKSYQGVNAEKALRAYSGGGYGASDMGLDPNRNFQEQIANASVLDGLVRAMAKREGYTGKANQGAIKFTDSQIATGAASAGMNIADFKNLTADQQNEYVYGAKSGLSGGRLPSTEIDKYKKVIDEELTAGSGVGELRELIDNSDIPQADKEALKQYIEEAGKNQNNWFDKILDNLF